MNYIGLSILFTQRITENTSFDQINVFVKKIGVVNLIFSLEKLMCVTSFKKFYKSSLHLLMWLNPGGLNTGILSIFN